jgi:hypothetical protein
MECRFAITANSFQIALSSSASHGLFEGGAIKIPTRRKLLTYITCGLGMLLCFVSYARE